MSKHPRQNASKKGKSPRRFSPHFIRRLSSWLILSTALTGAGRGQVTLSGALTGTATSGLTFSGYNTTVLSGGAANTFTGNITINSGTLSVAADNNLGNAANTITFGALGGGTLLESAGF